MSRPETKYLTGVEKANFQTRKEIIGVKYFHSYLVFTVTFLFWFGNCSSLSEQYSILPPKIFQHT